jgi:mannose-6-phosphate isomerase-like protein (cupin superfamily)
MIYRNLRDLERQTVSHDPDIAKAVIIRPGEVANLTNFSQAWFQPGQIAGAHAHADMLEVFFVRSGNGVISVDGKSHVLEANTCVVVQPGETHEIRNSGEQVLELLYFGIQCNGSE